MNFSWGNAFSDSLIKGYTFGKALKTDLAANEYADEISRNKAISEEDLKAGLATNKSAYENALLESRPDLMGDTIERLNSAESFNKDIEDAKAGLAAKYGENTPEYKAAIEQYLPELEQRKSENIQALREDQGKINAIRSEMIQNKALADRQAADAKVRSSAYTKRSQADSEAARKYYSKTGQIDKIQKLDDLSRFRDMLNDENMMNGYLLETYNASLPDGQRVVINKDGNSLSVVDTDGNIQGQLPMPSLAQRQEMLYSQIGRMAMTSLDDTTANRALKLEEIGANKANRAATQAMKQRELDMKEKYYNFRMNGGVPAGSGGSGGSAGYNSKGGLHFDNVVETGDERVGNYQPVKDKANGKEIGRAYINTNLFVPSTSNYAAEAKKRQDAKEAGVGYLMVRSNDAVANVYVLQNGEKYATLEAALNAKNGATGQRETAINPNADIDTYLAQGGRNAQGVPVMYDHRGQGNMNYTGEDAPKPNAAAIRNLENAQKVNPGVDNFGTVDTGAAAGIPTEANAAFSQKIKDATGTAANAINGVGRVLGQAGTEAKAALNKNAIDAIANVFKPFMSGESWSKALSELKTVLNRTGNEADQNVWKPFDDALLGKGETRGERNNNPLNVKTSANNKWQGSAGSDGTFEKFKTPEDGVRAGAKTIQSNISAVANKKGMFSINKLIERYAPSSENNTKAYAKSVAKALGVEPNRLLDVSQYKAGSDKFKKLVAAMIDVEVGKGASKKYKAIIDKIA